MSRYGSPMHHNRQRLHDMAQAKRATGGAPPAPVAPPVAPVPASRAHEPIPKLTRAQSAVFAVLDPAAVCIVATDGPVSVVLWGRNGEPEKRLGHNRGIRPARVVKSGTWKDSVGNTWNKNPLIPMATQIRLWAPSVQERDRVADVVLELMAAREEEHGGSELLAHGFRDLGPQLDIGLFREEIRGIGERASIKLWDDGELIVWATRVYAKAEARQRRPGDLDRAIETVIAQELGR